MAQDGIEATRKHVAKMARKVERVSVLAALLDMHESSPDYDPEYVEGLRFRLRNARAQLKAMGGGD